jgi:transposase-like protein
LVKSWDFAANHQNPAEISQTSQEVFHWVCVQCGYKWTSSALSRIKARADCPRCALKERSHRKLLLDGSLALKFPEISKEWDTERNPQDLLPTNILPGVKTKVWWRCSDCNNSWLAKVNSRTKMGAGCPKCAFERGATARRLSSISKTGSLLMTHPDIAKEWHPSKNNGLTANEVTKSHGKKVWWRCPKGHEYQAKPQNRTYGGTACPLCRPQTSLLEIRVLAELEALIGQCRWREKVNGYEIDVWLPSLQLGIEVDGYPWHLGKEKADKHKSTMISALGGKLIHVRHELLAKICTSDVVFSGRTPVKQTMNGIVRAIESLGYISTERLRAYENSDQFINVDRYNEISSWLPNPQPEKSLAYLKPDLSAEWLSGENSPHTPASVTPGSDLRVKWRCHKGHVWAAIISNRARLNSGCPMCHGIIASPENNASTNLFLRELWDSEKNSIELQELTPRSNKPVWWRCPKGHSFEMSPANLTRRYLCPVCTNRRIVKENSLSSKRPALAVFWDQSANGDSTDPTMIAPSTAKKFWWKCKICDHSWFNSPNQMSRKDENKICPNWRNH